ncbi:MAG: SPOR domain-containing protein [Thermoanaerobacteraceae bacterium]|nr:SPOR domain-containing protein [Thermoanaerobacteraceae bacterium]
MTKALAENIRYYVVQVGYYKNTAIMENAFNLIAKQGLPIYKVTYDGGYRIFLGNYDSREEAEKAAKTVNEMGFETLIRTMEKKAKDTPTISPSKEKVEEISDEITNKLPVNTAQQNFESQTDINEETALPTYKAQLPQKKDNLSYTPHEFRKTDNKKLNKEPYSLTENQDKSVYCMFCSMLIIIISIGVIATHKRNQKE